LKPNWSRNSETLKLQYKFNETAFCSTQLGSIDTRLEPNMSNHIRADGRVHRLATDSSALAYSVPDAATRIGVSRSTLYTLIAAGQIPIAKVGSRTLVLDQDLHDFLLRSRAETAPTGEAAA
jgi:excisionase family DNA binding protein